MNTENSPEKNSPGNEKAREYAQRLIDGETNLAIITAGLGPVMVQGIMAELERRGYASGDYIAPEITGLELPQEIISELPTSKDSIKIQNEILSVPEITEGTAGDESSLVGLVEEKKEILLGDVENADVPPEGIPEESDTTLEMSPASAFGKKMIVEPNSELPHESSGSIITDERVVATALEKVLEENVTETIHSSRLESKNDVSIHEQARLAGSQLRNAVDDLSRLITSRNRQDQTNFFENGGLNLLLDGSESLSRAIQSNETVAVARSISDIIDGLQMFGRNTTNSTKDTPRSIDEVGYSLETVRRSLMALQDVYSKDSNHELARLKDDLNRGISMIPRHQDFVMRLSTALRRLQNY